MANQRVLPQSKETLLQNYNKRLKDDIKSIMDNFTEIIKTAKVIVMEPFLFLLSFFYVSKTIRPEQHHSFCVLPLRTFNANI